MGLTTGDWVKLIAAAVLTVCGHFVVREWYQPYVHYVTGGAYIHPTLSIAHVGLKNLGGSDAENVIISALFPNPLTAISPGPMGAHFDISEGGPGHKSVVGTIKRLVPDELAYIYFTMEPSTLWSAPDRFIQGIKFNGGQGKTREPILRTWVLPFLGVGAIGGMMWIPSRYLGRWLQRKDDAQFSEIIKLGVSAAQEGLTEEQLHAKVEERYKDTMPSFSRYSKQFSMLCAQAAFERARQSPTQTAGPMS